MTFTKIVDGKKVPMTDEEAAAIKAEWAASPLARVTAYDVRAEASRRMMALVGARDAAHLEIIIANGTREAVRLLRRGAETWTPDEAQRAAELEALDLAIEAIRAASNRLEADPPADFQDPKHWPQRGLT